MSHRAPAPPIARRPGRHVRSYLAPPGLRRTVGALAGLLAGAPAEAYGSLRFAGRLLVLITAGLAGEAVWAALRACRSVGRSLRRPGVVRRGALGRAAGQDGGSR